MRGYIFVLLAAAFWSLIGPVARFAFDAGATAMETAFWRAALASVFFFVHSAKTGAFKVRPADLPVLMLFGLFGVTVFFAAYLLCVKYGGAALASVLLYTAPAWVAVLSRIFLRETMTAIKVAAVAMTLVGAAGVSIGSSPDGLHFGAGPWAVFWGLVSGLAYAMYYIFGKAYLSRYPAQTLFLYAMPVGALGLLPFVEFGDKAPSAWVYIIILAFCATYLPYYFYCVALKYLEPTRVAVVASLEPVMAAGLAYWWWGERFSPAGFVGSGLILAGVLTAIADGARQGRVPVSPE